jgi:integrase/recombinase XerD
MWTDRENAMPEVDGRRRGRIVVAGPLAPFAEGMRRDLGGQGYALDTIAEHVHLLAGLSDWLSVQGLAACDLDSAAIEGFLRERRAMGQRIGMTPRGLAPVLGYLQRIGAAPPPMARVVTTPLETLLAAYRDHLEGERGLSAGTVRHYLRCARRFLAWLPTPVTDGLTDLSAGQVTSYVLGWTSAGRTASGRAGGTVDMVTLPALRSLLRFLHVTGRVPGPLAGAVPAGRRRPARVEAPRAARHDDVQAVLTGCDRDGAAGRRDYAMLLLMTRLALRGGEVARLDLADVNWRAGELTVHGKGGRLDVLPLPPDVGEAMADYLLHARPTTAARTVFVTLKAPFTAMATSTVTVMVARACARARVARFGPHRIRHTTACDLLAAGGSMEEIGQLLRHAQQRTTAVYAKVDQARLLDLARPCPQPAVR